MRIFLIFFLFLCSCSLRDLEHRDIPTSLKSANTKSIAQDSKQKKPDDLSYVLEDRLNQISEMESDQENYLLIKNSIFGYDYSPIFLNVLKYNAFEWSFYVIYNEKKSNLKLYKHLLDRHIFYYTINDVKYTDRNLSKVYSPELGTINCNIYAYSKREKYSNFNRRLDFYKKFYFPKENQTASDSVQISYDNTQQNDLSIKTESSRILTDFCSSKLEKYKHRPKNRFWKVYNYLSCNSCLGNSKYDRFNTVYLDFGIINRNFLVHNFKICELIISDKSKPVYLKLKDKASNVIYLKQEVNRKITLSRREKSSIRRHQLIQRADFNEKHSIQYIQKWMSIKKTKHDKYPRFKP